MEFYHGTTLSSARGIIENGFRPRGGAVWFTNKRMEVARLLPMLNRVEYRTLFDIARHDPNPAVKRSAKKQYQN